METVSKLNPEWVKQAREQLLEFLAATDFPHPVRNGRRGSAFEYPEWLIILIAVLSVKCGIKTYLGIHRMTLEYWSCLTPDSHLSPICESQLRERLKKICHSLGKPAAVVFQLFPELLWVGWGTETPTSTAKSLAKSPFKSTSGSSERRQDDDQGARPGVAQKAKDAQSGAQRFAQSGAQRFARSG